MLRHPASPRSRSRCIAPTPPLSPGSPPRALSSLATFLEDAVARAWLRHRTSEGGCAFPPVARVPASHSPAAARPVLGVLAAGRGGPPLCASPGSGPCTARQFLSGLLSLHPGPPPALTDPRGPRLASRAQRSASLTRLPTLSSLLYSFFPRISLPCCSSSLTF